MGLLPFKKKKHPSSQTADNGVQNTVVPQTAATTSNITSPTTDVGPKPKWSPMRRILSSKTPATNASSTGGGSSSGMVQTVSVIGKDNIEVMTLESQRELMDQREVIRKKLFESGNSNDDDNFNPYGSPDVTMKRTATNMSQEVLSNGRIQDSIEISKSDRFSIPIQLVNRGGSWNESLQKISEEPVDYRKARSSGPISLDHSYTESELASVMTKHTMTPQSHMAAQSNTANPIAAEIETCDVKEYPAVVSPANTTQSSIPMDEKMDELELQRILNTGKSPLKGMPDDEQSEYQKDEMESAAVSPIRNDGLDFTTALTSSFRFLQGKNVQAPVVSPEQHSTSDEKNVDEAVSNTSVIKTANDDLPNLFDMESPSTEIDVPDEGVATSSPTLSATSAAIESLKRVPELGRSILRAAYECSSVTNETKACADAIDGTSSELRDGNNIKGGDEASSLTSLNFSNKRPILLDEATVLRFVRRITNNGFVLLYLQAPDENESEINIADEWKGRTVTMMITKGLVSSTSTFLDNTFEKSENRLPQLEWTTVTGGQTLEPTTTSLNLLKIQSILTNDDDVEDEDDMCFFTITSEDGEIHIFETATVEERDRIVNGLKTLISRWSFHLIQGDVTATSELFESYGYQINLNQSGDDLPSLPNPNHTMNYVTHILLDQLS